MARLSLILVTLACAAAGASCGTSDPTVNKDARTDADATVELEAWDFIWEEMNNPEIMGGVTGTVFSPAASMQYRFPIPKALVYLTRNEPPAIPDRAYCDKCLDLPSNTPYAITDNQGTFTIAGIPGGDWNIVVQKGQFRRARRITIQGGETLAVPQDITTLPSRNDAGLLDTIPRIAVASGEYDWMEDLLAKFGLASLGADLHYTRGSEQFELFYNGGRAYGTGYEDFRDFLRRPVGTDGADDLGDFNILFIPCSNTHSDEVLDEPAVLENIRAFVQGGGKLYVADFSYDFVEKAFPRFIDFAGEDNNLGAAEHAFEDFWDTKGIVRDPDLSSWLVGLGLTPGDIDFFKNWVSVEATASVAGLDEGGNPVDITPDEKILGTVPGRGQKPLNIVFTYGCGKVLYTTYHTIGALTGTPRPELIPQEKILLYLILDIAVCSDDVVIPI